MSNNSGILIKDTPKINEDIIFNISKHLSLVADYNVIMHDTLKGTNGVWNKEGPLRTFCSRQCTGVL